MVDGCRWTSRSSSRVYWRHKPIVELLVKAIQLTLMDPCDERQYRIEWAESLQSLWICGTLMLHPSPAVLCQLFQAPWLCQFDMQSLRGAHGGVPAPTQVVETTVRLRLRHILHICRAMGFVPWSPGWAVYPHACHRPRVDAHLVARGPSARKSGNA